jgi:AcrR family transcriptional regulator
MSEPEKAKKTDRRIGRTLRLLQDALFTLILEKPYSAITVQDIIDRANVGRSTFYAHCRDKDDLLLRGFENMLDALSLHMDQEGIAATGLGMFPSLGLFRHVQDNHQLFKAMVWGQGVDLLFKHGQAYLAERIESHLSGLSVGGQESGVPLPVLSNFLAGAFIVLLKWWLDNRMPYSPERMDELYQQLVMPGVRNVLG